VPRPTPTTVARVFHTSGNSTAATAYRTKAIRASESLLDARLEGGTLTEVDRVGDDVARGR